MGRRFFFVDKRFGCFVRLSPSSPRSVREGTDLGEDGDYLLSEWRLSAFRMATICFQNSAALMRELTPIARRLLISADILEVRRALPVDVFHPLFQLSVNPVGTVNIPL